MSGIALVGGVPAKLTPPAIRKCQGYNKLSKVKYFQNAYPRPVLDGGKIKFLFNNRARLRKTWIQDKFPPSDRFFKITTYKRDWLY